MRISLPVLIICACALATSCATKPSDIAPIAVSSSEYSGWGTPQLVGEKARISSELDRLIPLQQKAHQKDKMGVFWIGVPTGSMGGGNKEYEIGKLRGQQNAVEQELRRRGGS